MYDDLFFKLEKEFDFVTANEIRKESGRALREGEITMIEWEEVNQKVSDLRSQYRQRQETEGIAIGTPVSIGGIPKDRDRSQ